MASSEIVPRNTTTQIIEGTPAEIIERLREMRGNTKLTLIIPGEEVAENKNSQLPHVPEALHAAMPFAQILAPLQEDFDASGMTDEELGDFVDAELNAYRAERRANEQSANGR